MTIASRGMARVLLCAAFVALSAHCSSAATLSAERLANLFSQGKEFFRRANEAAATDPEEARDLYRRALMRFESITREGGIHNGKLYYNIGNTYFRTGDIGRAVLYYRRAQLFIPNDPNLRQNLSYARSKRIDRIGEKQEAKILKTLFFWHYDLPAKARLTLFTCFFAALCMGASIRLFVRRTALNWALMISGFMAALFLGSLLLEAAVRARDVSGVILAAEVVARKGDGETYQPSFKEPLHAGTEFKLIERRRDWYQIELPDGRRCWVPAKATELVGQLSGPA